MDTRGTQGPLPYQATTIPADSRATTTLPG